jgi:hypothetical protein
MHSLFLPTGRRSSGLFPVLNMHLRSQNDSASNGGKATPSLSPKAKVSSQGRFHLSIQRTAAAKAVEKIKVTAEDEALGKAFWKGRTLCFRYRSFFGQPGLSSTDN